MLYAFRVNLFIVFYKLTLYPLINGGKDIIGNILNKTSIRNSLYFWILLFILTLLKKLKPLVNNDQIMMGVYIAYGFQIIYFLYHLIYG